MLTRATYFSQVPLANSIHRNIILFLRH